MRKFRNTTLLLLTMNFFLLGQLFKKFLELASVTPLLCTALPLSLQISIIICFVITEILPCYEKGLSLRLQVLSGGYELILSSIYALFIEVLGYILLFTCKIQGAPL